MLAVRDQDILLDSPLSLEETVRRMSAGDQREHNVGGCGACGGSGAGCCAACGPGGKAMSPGAAAAARLAASFLAPWGGQIASMLSTLARDGGMPKDLDTEKLAGILGQDAPCVPYQDAVRDCLCMVELPSQRVTAVAGAVTNLVIQPQSGWFFAYYMDINVNRPGTPPANPCVPPCEYLIERPRVRGCPTSPCIPPAVPAVAGSTTIPMAANFLSAPQTCSGCGRPFIAVIPNLSNGTPLEVNLFGLATGDIAQAVVRGFCFDTRICC